MHGIDYYETIKFLDEPSLIEISADTTDGTWFFSIGQIDGKHRTAVTSTMRIQTYQYLLRALFQKDRGCHI